MSKSTPTGIHRILIVTGHARIHIDGMRHVASVIFMRFCIGMSRALLIISLSLFTSLAIPAPPNPSYYFNVDVVTGELHPKFPQSALKFMQALDGCCFAAPQRNLQPDGVEYVLALKVDFVDVPGLRTGTELTQYLFDTDGVSLKTYYWENSYGQMDIQPGPLGGVVPAGNRWVRAKKPMGYYGEGGGVNVVRSQELVREVCQAVDASIDFSQYDRDKDGRVEHVFIIHSGNDNATSGVPEDIWSALIPGIGLTVDSVLIDTAVLVAEEPDFEYPHLGIYFHEFFHNFGAPDIYGLNFTDARDNKWSLMGAFGPYQGPDVRGFGNGLAPSHIMGYLKWDFDGRPENGRVGWIEPVTITQNGNFSIPSFALPPKTDKLFKIDITNLANRFGDSLGRNVSEFFLIENRYKASGTRFDTYLPESGILIWHIDERYVRPVGSFDASQQIWLEDPTDPEHIGISETGTGFIDIQRITNGAAYSADDGQTSFTPGSLPNSNANDGTVTGISITNIGPEGLTVPISVSFGDTYEPNDTFARAFPIRYGQLYESFIFDATDTRDIYQLEVLKGITIRVTLTHVSRLQKYALFLMDGRNEIRKEADLDISSSNPAELITNSIRLQLVYQPDVTGTFYIIIESDGGFSNVDSYRLQVEQLEAGAFGIASLRIYPNPLRLDDGMMNFEYQLAASQTADSVKLEIFSLAGDIVYNDMHREVFSGGTFQWRGVTRTGSQIAPGIYVYRISASQADISTQEIGKVILLK